MVRRSSWFIGKRIKSQESRIKKTAAAMNLEPSTMNTFYQL
jgi:hypothetical protein